MQHETEKAKFNEDISTLKEANQKIDAEYQHLKLRNSEQKSIIDTQNEKIR